MKIYDAVVLEYLDRDKILDYLEEVYSKDTDDIVAMLDYRNQDLCIEEYQTRH